MRPRKRFDRRAARLLGAMTLLTLALAVPAPAASAGTVTFGSGHLDWGVKQSFRSYIVGPIAKGSYTASAGAVKNPDGTVRFDVLGGQYDDVAGNGELLIDGTVRFEGHHGTLDMTIRNIRVVLAGAAGTLYADVDSNDLSGTMQRYPGVDLAELGPVAGPEPVADGLSWASIPAKLTAAGAPAFGPYYSAGEAIDPLAPLTAIYGTPRSRPDRGGGGGSGGGGGDTGGSSEKPSVKASAKAVTVAGSRAVRIATLRCGNASCTIKAPKSVKVKIGGKRYRVAVLAPNSLKAGKAGKLRVKLAKKARQALAGRKAKVKVKVTIAAAGEKTTKTVKATLKAKG